MRRVLRRFFASAPDPLKSQPLSPAELAVLKKTQEFEKSLEKQDWAKNFATDSDADNYQVPDVVKPQDSLAPAEFSSDEEIVPFFIDDLKQVQYVYKTKVKLEFDAEGLACIYEKKRKWLKFEKFTYCRSLGWSYFLAGYFFANHVYFSGFSSIIALLVPSVFMSRALLTDKIAINKEGTQVFVWTRRFHWSFSRQRIIDIKDFDLPKGQKFALWKAYEFPDDLKTYMETSALEKYCYIKRLPKAYWSFLLLPGKPDLVNREVLVNVLNGVYIDTEGGGAEDLQQRYVVLDRKDIKGD